jgi:predicted ATP-grasp superfamily ATP-dependent carboligase
LSTVTIFEYASGGGFLGRNIPHNILCEGYAMLKTAIDDFQSSGYTVKTLLDPRLTDLRDHLPTGIAEVSARDAYDRTLNEMVRKSDLSLIIAPETGGLLSTLVQMAGDFTASLNSTPEAITSSSDKAALAEMLGHKGLRVPETICLTVEDGREEAVKAYRELAPKAVVKPVNGVGCEDTWLVTNRVQMEDAFTALAKGDLHKRFVVQRFVNGLPASVSLISTGKKCKPIALNRQRVSISSPPHPSAYRGGFTPFHHPDADSAFRVAQESVSLFGGLRGYIGTDLILSPDGPVVLEINPRLTVSYVGLERVVRNGLAEQMVRSAIDKKIPTSFETQGHSAFTKLTHDAAYRAAEGELLFPRIRVDGRYTSETLLVTKSRTVNENTSKTHKHEDAEQITTEALEV